MKNLFLDSTGRKQKPLNVSGQETPVKNPVSFGAFMRDEMLQSKIKESTMKSHLSTLRILETYKPDLCVEEVTYNFLRGFEEFLLRRDYHCNTIAKHFKNLKRYINLAVNKDMYSLQHYPFRKYRIRHQVTKRAHLTPAELSKLEKLHLDNESRRRCLDMFLFSCYTGIRFSDAVRLTRNNFCIVDNKIWLIYTSVKTNTCIRLPLSLLFDGKAITIYKRYRYRKDSLFGISAHANSSINKQLLKIAELAVINKKISFHTARHTNATLLLYRGANITTVQKILGHKSVQTTEIYSSVMDMTVIRDLEYIIRKKEK
jgi:integrase